MKKWTIKRPADLTLVPWRNGLGTTRDIITTLDGEGALRWQVSIATLLHDAAFSHFPHCDRVFTPIAGSPPPELAFEGGAFTPCPLLIPKPFSGEVPTLSRIPAPGQAFNAVADRRYHTMQVTVLRLAPGTPIEVPAAPHSVLYCHQGAIKLGPDQLSPGDSAIGPGPTPTAAETTIAILVAVLPA